MMIVVVAVWAGGWFAIESSGEPIVIEPLTNMVVFKKHPVIEVAN